MQSKAILELEQQVEKLKTISEIQEQILDRKDEEIEDLRKQRDWLQSRIEKLEEKAERDQLLLLAETQTIKQLISIQHKRKSLFRATLERIGLATPDPVLAALDSPIEIKKDQA